MAGDLLLPLTGASPPDLMQATIEPISAVPGALVRDLLVRYGLQEAIINWKYFDPAFRPEGERGYVWMRDGLVQGMIGLIPFRIAAAAGTVRTAWTCDWFVDSSVKNPGIGVLLLKEAIERSGLLFTIGGNEATARLMPRLATHTLPAAAVEMTLPLSLGGTATYRRMEARIPAVSALGLATLGLPRRAQQGEPSAITVARQEGVHPSLIRLVEEGSPGGAPMYDAAALDWQFVRCPVIAATSFVAGEGAQAHAAAICWRRPEGSRWRLVLWARPGAEAEASAVVSEAVKEIGRRRGHAVSALVASGDSLTCSVLTRAGFREAATRLPLYVLARNPEGSTAGLTRLSFADSDLGYRF